MGAATECATGSVLARFGADVLVGFKPRHLWAALTHSLGRQMQSGPVQEVRPLCDSYKL
jgi:hypothetical protein